MSDRVIDRQIAELQAVVRGLELAAGGSVEQHDRWTRTAAMMLGTAVDALVSERDRADGLLERAKAAVDGLYDSAEKNEPAAVYDVQRGFLAGTRSAANILSDVFGLVRRG